MTSYSVSQLLAQAECYKILAALFCKPEAGIHDSTQLYNDLVHSTELLKPKALEMAKKLRETVTGLDVEDLIPEYTRLFTGQTNVPAHPCGSMYLGKQQFEVEFAEWITDYYSKGGFDSRQQNHPPDHISTELLFIFHLLIKATEGFQHDNPEMATFFSEIRCQFIREHMINWVPEFSRRILVNSKSLYYLQLSILNRTLLVNCTGERNEILD